MQYFGSLEGTSKKGQNEKVRNLSELFYFSLLFNFENSDSAPFKLGII